MAWRQNYHLQKEILRITSSTQYQRLQTLSYCLKIICSEGGSCQLDSENFLSDLQYPHSLFSEEKYLPNHRITTRDNTENEGIRSSLHLQNNELS